MSVNNSVIERYAAIWNEADPEKRMDLVGWTFTEDGTYQDPILTGRGHELLNQMFGAAQAQLPGARLSLVGEPETHHDWVRFRWQITMSGSWTRCRPRCCRSATPGMAAPLSPNDSPLRHPPVPAPLLGPRGLHVLSAPRPAQGDEGTREGRAPGARPSFRSTLKADGYRPTTED
jgi:hypothetical protein